MSIADTIAAAQQKIAGFEAAIADKEQELAGLRTTKEIHSSAVAALQNLPPEQVAVLDAVHEDAP